MIVTLEQAKAHLRIDHDSLDADIKLKLAGAEARILHHLDGLDLNKLKPDEIAIIRAAVLNLVGWLDRIRANEEATGDERFWLPATVHQLLMPLRQPAAV